MPTAGHGIVKTGRNEEQPQDKARAQDPSSPRQDAEQRKPPKGQTEQPDTKRPA